MKQKQILQTILFSIIALIIGTIYGKFIDNIDRTFANISSTIRSISVNAKIDSIQSADIKGLKDFTVELNNGKIYNTREETVSLIDGVNDQIRINLRMIIKLNELVKLSNAKLDGIIAGLSVSQCEDTLSKPANETVYVK